MVSNDLFWKDVNFFLFVREMFENKKIPLCIKYNNLRGLLTLSRWFTFSPKQYSCLISLVSLAYLNGCV